MERIVRQCTLTTPKRLSWHLSVLVTPTITCGGPCKYQVITRRLESRYSNGVLDVVVVVVFLILLKVSLFATNGRLFP